MPLRPIQITSQSLSYWASAVQNTTELTTILSTNRIDKQQRLVEDVARIYRYDDQASGGDEQPTDSDGTGIGSGNGWWILVGVAGSDHQGLSSLQGGSALERYHLTAAQHTIAIQAASATVSGYITATAQTLAGLKTFGDGIATDTISEEAAGNGVSIDGLSIKDSGFGLAGSADGDMYQRNAGVLAKIPKGNSGEVLTSDGLIAAWSPAGGGGGASQFDATVADTGADFTNIDDAYNAGNINILISGNLTQSTDITIDTQNLYVYVPVGVTLTMSTFIFSMATASKELIVEGQGKITTATTSGATFGGGTNVNPHVKITLNGLEIISDNDFNIPIVKYGSVRMNDIHLTIPNRQGTGILVAFSEYIINNLWITGGGTSCYWAIKQLGGGSSLLIDNVYIDGTWANITTSPIFELREDTTANNFSFDTSSFVWVDVSGVINNFKTISTNVNITSAINSQGRTILNNLYLGNGTLDLENKSDFKISNVKCGILDLSSASCKNALISDSEFSNNMTIGGSGHQFSNCKIQGSITMNSGADNNKFTGCNLGGSITLNSGADNNIFTGNKIVGTITDNGTGNVIIDGVARYGDMHLHNNVVATVINTANIPHAVQGLFALEKASNFTFNAGSTGAITAMASGVNTTITSTAHGLANGNVVTISGTTSYNGIFVISAVTANTFDISAAFVANDATGNWYQGDNLQLSSGSGNAGIYKCEFHCFGVSGGNNKDFEFEIYVNEVAQENCESSRRFANATDKGSMGGGGIITLAVGDIVSFAITGLTDTSNFTLNHTNIVLHKIG